MHEASVAREVYDIVYRTAKINDINKIYKITIQVGEFSCIQHEMLKFAFDMLAKDTIMDGASLEFETCRAMAVCPVCKEKFYITFTDKVCKKCNVVSHDIISGHEAIVKDIEGE